MRAPLNLQRWIDEHRDLLKPPVGNAQIWEDGDFIVTVVGGPNQRTDYHDDPLEEFFYQLKGDMVLRDHRGRPSDATCRSARATSSCCRRTSGIRRSGPAGSVGLVIEYRRPPGVRRRVRVVLPRHATRVVHRVEVQLQSIVRDLPPLFAQFYGDAALRRCPACGAVHPGKAAAP